MVEYPNEKVVAWQLASDFAPTMYAGRAKPVPASAERYAAPAPRGCLNRWNTTVVTANGEDDGG